MIGFILSLVIQTLVLLVRVVLILVVWTFRFIAFVVAGIIGFVVSRWPRRTVPPALRSPIDPEVRWAIYRRDGYACLRCGSETDLTIDHIHPVALGGTNHHSNLQTLCRSCNAGKGMLLGRHDYRRPAEFARG